MPILAFCKSWFILLQDNYYISSLIFNLLSTALMNKIFLAPVCFALMTIFSSCQTKNEWNSLFNGNDLDNWEMFIGKSLGPAFDSLAENALIDNVFSVTELSGEPVIHISGEVNGSLATKESFENYHLRLVYKWGEIVYSRRNSGLLYHSFGDFGVALGTWMPCIELQLMNENLGDTYLMAHTSCESPATKNEEKNQFFYTPGAERILFGAHAAGQSIRKSQNAENAIGEWNTIDLYCFDRTSVHVVNGIPVMVNYNNGYFENDEVKALSSGKIQIQSEGAELFIKQIDIKKISRIPEEFLAE
jgi:hypothetical protein